MCRRVLAGGYAVISMAGVVASAVSIAIVILLVYPVNATAAGGSVVLAVAIAIVILLVCPVDVPPPVMVWPVVFAGLIAIVILLVCPVYAVMGWPAPVAVPIAIVPMGWRVVPVLAR